MPLVPDAPDEPIKTVHFPKASEADRLWDEEQRRHYRRLALMRMQGDVNRTETRWIIAGVIAVVVLVTVLLLA